jgi:hypothetical protein
VIFDPAQEGHLYDPQQGLFMRPIPTRNGDDSLPHLLVILIAGLDRGHYWGDVALRAVAFFAALWRCLAENV